VTGSPIRAVRRVVVAGDDHGQAHIVADGPSPHVHTLPGMPADLGLTDLWYTDGAPSDPTSVDPADRELSVAPVQGGTLFRLVQFPPDDELPHDERGAPQLFWHETSTVDYNLLLEGTLWLLTGDDEIELHPFDVVVVRGGRHAWSNRADTPALLVTVGVDLSV
jgi:hypothetical protein